jgi:L-fucose mutarotase
MLKNIHPILSADLLSVLQGMGHGDVLAIVDRNYPASSTARRLVSLPGTTMNDVATAIFSVLPVDTFVEPAVWRMGPVDDPEQVLDVHADFQRIVDAAEERTVTIAPVERFDFYARAREAYAVVATSEDRPYGCFLVTKGVV